MIYLKSDNNDKVIYQHNMPFDEKYGLGKTQEALEQEGLLVNTLPSEPTVIDRQVAVLYVNPIRWELEDRPLTQEEKLQDMVDAGTMTPEQMAYLLEI